MAATVLAFPERVFRPDLERIFRMLDSGCESMALRGRLHKVTHEDETPPPSREGMLISHVITGLRVGGCAAAGDTDTVSAQEIVDGLGLAFFALGEMLCVQREEISSMFPPAA